MKSPKAIAFGLFALLLIVAAVSRKPLENAFLQNNLDGNQKCITNLACIEATSGAFSNLTVVTINGVTVAGANANVNLLEVFNMGTNLVTQGATNHYWLDMAHTNSAGLIDIYATLSATNDIQFEMPTNGFRGALLSFNVLASGADRIIYMPTNFPHFNTNDAGFALAGIKYVLRLTNGTEFRLSVQSNNTYSTLSRTF